jgi:phospholipid transport system substrate-binding protein
VFDRRSFFGCLAILSIGFSGAARAGDADEAVAVVQKLQDSQIEVLRRGTKMSLQERYDALRPALAAAFDLDGMAKLAHGPGFDALSEADRGDWVKSFGDYVAATYAQRFEFLEAKGFERDVKVEPRDGAMVVGARMIPLSGEPMPVDYVLKATPRGWRISDILANGSVSELTQWRRALKGVALKDLRQRAASLLER